MQDLAPGLGEIEFADFKKELRQVLIAAESRLYHIFEAGKEFKPQLRLEKEDILAINETGPVCAAATANGYIRMWRNGMEWEDKDSLVLYIIKSIQNAIS